MSRTLFMSMSFLVFFAVATALALSQASKQLDERAKAVATPQEKSWQQVDEINKETDKTKGRYQQAQQSGAQAQQKSGYSVKKSSIGSRSAYRKFSPPKKKTMSGKK